MMPYKIKYIPNMDPNIVNNTLELTPSKIESRNEENGFFLKLEKSILKDGFRNPIVVNAKTEGIEPVHGGSRLWVAQKYNLVFPCVIADFDDIFPDAFEILGGPTEILKYYTDKPKSIRLKKHRIQPAILDKYGNVIQYHMKEEI